MGKLVPSKPPSLTAVAVPSFANMVLPIVTASIFTAATLLLLVQQMFCKMVLPLLGGSPAVWTTALLFFQTALLLGYLYAHALGSLLPVRTQIAVHIAVMGAVVILLPIAIPADATPPSDGTPVAWLIGLFTVSVGLPYTVVSATSPLLQRWFASSGHESAADPYHLYVASNAGSLIGLLGYPLVVEPLVGVSAQSGVWSTGYFALIALIAASGIAIWRLAPGDVSPAVQTKNNEKTRVSNFDRLRWIALAFVPSSLLLGVTMHITTDIAAMPLLWVAPLALYLVTFMLAFAKRQLIPRAIALKAESIALALLMGLTLLGSVNVGGIAVYLIGFFAIALARHVALSDLRPDASRLTEFYLLLSLGGALGGVFNAVIAPMIFTSVLEFPIALLAAAATRLLIPGANTRFALPDLVLPALAALGAFALWFSGIDIAALPLRPVLVAAVVLVFAVYIVQDRPLRFALGLAGMFALLQIARHDAGLLLESRSFFGAYRVVTSHEGRYALFMHGTTLHGMQATDPARRHEPLSYYALRGPFGQAMTSLQTGRSSLHYGLVGVGAGASTCYARPTDSWALYEIDPMVVDIALNSGIFTFINDCIPRARIALGDARLSLAREPKAVFDVLILDAFSSDAIPMHLMTLEAMTLARAKLAPGGVILINISNRYLKLEPVVANTAHAAGLIGIAQVFRDPHGAHEEIRAPSHWIALAADPADLARISRSGDWHKLEPSSSAPLWTDDYSNVLGVLSFNAN
jgi:hypothetical protein